MSSNTSSHIKGRGAGSNTVSRFVELKREVVDDGWAPEESTPLRTELFTDTSRTIINSNNSPDVPFTYSINPYKGCEHGCCYCFARPTHAYLDLSPGLDFESKIFAKPDAANLLKNELGKRKYVPKVIALGANTDAYQPVERQLGITREIIQALKAYRHPVSIITKSALIERDIDLLAPMAETGLVKVFVSITTLDRTLSRQLEPRAAAPQRRLETVQRLQQAGIPVGVLMAPIIPVLNDNEIERLLEQCAGAGAESAGYVILRLPHELKDLFVRWLQEHYPLKAGHVMNRIRDLRDGRDYQSEFGERMRGSGQYADLIAHRFALACKKQGLNRRTLELDCSKFRVPPKSGDQMGLF
ncbi:PA0069 family radical SAM protein [Thiohalophilus thiocyanatoxydans]|uniref:DNA repair photolyase n=1 Tax=Thiohalophilus thiocyanatoxydans TaxID=381308 RepID=A0A4R8INR5_9GAMM|nr:PA0069 family radical SAM protein [Thiohalophilus thiocyanatoxydans]TDY02532.1 DNA repair photolyase [Thiohalophilus thiocyanatoxydans]